MIFDQVAAKNSLGWAKCVRAIIAKKGSHEVLDVLDSFPDKLSLQERLLLISLNAEIRRAVEINGEWHTVNDTDLILTAGESWQCHEQFEPFFVMSRRDYQGKYYHAKLEDIYNHVTNDKPENDEKREQIKPLSKQDRLTNAEKDAMIRNLISSENSANEHLKFTFVPGLLGYVIISDKSAPVPIPGFKGFRWTNYKMENGFANTFEECLAKAMAHAVKNE